MIFISTPFSRAAADRLERMNVPAYKIGSGECNNYPLLRHIASFGKPMILSTGMNTIESVGKAVAIFEIGARAVRAAAHHQPLSDAAAPGAPRRDGGAGQGVSARGDRPFRSHHRQRRLPRCHRARRVDPRAALHRPHGPRRARHRLLDGRGRVPRADRAVAHRCMPSSAAPRGRRRKSR